MIRARNLTTLFKCTKYNDLITQKKMVFYHTNINLEQMLKINIFLLSFVCYFLQIKL